MKKTDPSVYLIVWLETRSGTGGAAPPEPTLPTHIQLTLGSQSVGVLSSACQHHRNASADERAPALSSHSVSIRLHGVVRHQNRSQCLQSTPLSVCLTASAPVKAESEEQEGRGDAERGEELQSQSERVVCHR